MQDRVLAVLFLDQGVTQSGMFLMRSIRRAWFVSWMVKLVAQHRSTASKAFNS